MFAKTGSNSETDDAIPNCDSEVFAGCGLSTVFCAKTRAELAAARAAVRRTTDVARCHWSIVARKRLYFLDGRMSLIHGQLTKSTGAPRWRHSDSPVNGGIRKGWRRLSDDTVSHEHFGTLSAFSLSSRALHKHTSHCTRHSCPTVRNKIGAWKSSNLAESARDLHCAVGRSPGASPVPIRMEVPLGKLACLVRATVKNYRGEPLISSELVSKAWAINSQIPIVIA